MTSDDPPPRNVSETDEDAWIERSRRVALASHRLIGWIYWDPEAIRRYEQLGPPNGAGYYVASRAAPLAPAGDDVATAALYSILPAFVHASLEQVRTHTTFEDIARQRNEAVGDGLQRYTPEIVGPLAELGPHLWSAADRLDPAGRILFAAHRAAPRPDDPLQSAWLALNCIREWRGDTHWALVTANELTGVQAGLLHDAWLGYPGDWIPRSRGADDKALNAAIAGLEARGLASDGAVNTAGLALRDTIENDTDRISQAAWRFLGADRTDELIGYIDRVDHRFLERIDKTAGPNWMPAARDRRRQ